MVKHAMRNQNRPNLPANQTQERTRQLLRTMRPNRKGERYPQMIKATAIDTP